MRCYILKKRKKKKNVCRTDDMRKLCYINYNHFSGCNKITIYSSSKNICHGCSSLWRSFWELIQGSRFSSSWVKSLNTWLPGSLPLSALQWWEDKELGGSFLELTHNTGKQAVKFHQAVCPQRKGIRFGTWSNSTTT